MREFIHILIIVLFLILNTTIFAQNVGINTTGNPPNAAALLDINDDDGTPNTGLLIPRMTLAQRTAMNPLPAAAQGLIVYQTDGLQGIYYNSSLTTTPIWARLTGNGSLGWALAGNTATTPGTDFLGTTDAKDVIFKTNNVEIMRITSGGFVGINQTVPTTYLNLKTTDPTKDLILSSHNSNATALAYYAAQGEVSDPAGIPAYTAAQGYLGYHNSNNKTYSIYGKGGDLAGYFEGKIGINSVSTMLPAHTMEIRNPATTVTSVDVFLRRFTIASVQNTALANIDFGDNYGLTPQAKIQVLRDETSTNNTDMPTGISFHTTKDGTAVATEKFRMSHKGQLEVYNTGNSIFMGQQAGELDDLSNNLNVFIGHQSGMANVIATDNVFVGYQVGTVSTVGFNTGLGSKSLLNTTTGASNTALGYNTLVTNISGASNVAVGAAALNASNSSNNTAVGVSALTLATGANNIALGFQAGNNLTTGGRNIIIGYDIDANTATTSNQLNIGNLLFGTGIDGTATTLSSGNIGIGLIAPGARLEVGSTAASDGIDISNTALDGDPVLRYQLNNISQFTMGVNDGAADQFTIAGGASLGTANDFFTILSTGKIGIGTITPNEQLEVVGNIRSTTLSGVGSRMVQADVNGTFAALAAGTASQVLLGTGVWGSVPAGGNNWSILGNAATNPTNNFLGTTDLKDLVFRTNNIEKMRILSGGNVGIGTNNSSNNLEIVGGATGAETNVLQIRSKFGTANTATTIQLVNSVTSGVAAGSAEISAIRTLVGGNTDLLFRTHNGLALAEQMRILANGNVGIGAVAPATKLEVAGSIRSTALAGVGSRMMQADVNGTFAVLAAGTTSQVLLGTGVWGNVPPGGNNWGILGNAATNPANNFLGTTDLKDLVFRTNNIERVRVNSSGNMGVGTNTPSTQLEIRGGATGVETNVLQVRSNFSTASTATTLKLINSATTGSAAGSAEITSLRTNIGGNTDLMFRTYSGVALVEQMRILANGNVGIGAVAPATKLEVAGSIRSTTLAGVGSRMVQADVNGTFAALAVGTASQVLLGTGVWGSVPAGGNNWGITGNATTNPATDFIGTTDLKDFVIRTNSVENLRVKSAGNVGVGISTPGAKFEVSSAGASDGIDISNTALDGDPVLRYQLGNTTQFTMGVNDGAADQFTIAGGASLGGLSDYFTILSTGETGIGTITPTVQLQVDGGSNATLLNGSGYFLTNIETATNIVIDDDEIMARNNGVKSTLLMQNQGGSLLIHNTVAGTEFAVLDAGNVGIGTNAPGTKLEVVSALASDGIEINNTLLVGNPVLQYSLSGVAKFTMGVDDANADRFKIASGAALGTAATDYFTIEAAGDVGVGTNNPVVKFEVESNGASDGIDIDNSLLLGDPVLRFKLSNSSKFTIGVDDSDVDKFKIAKAASLGTASDILIIESTTGDLGLGITNPTVQFELSRDEGKKPLTATWTITSDERLKNIDGKYTKGLSDILKLNPITYHYKNVGEKIFSEEVLKTQAIGFSAQEVQKIFPESVMRDDEGYLNLNIHAILIAYVNAIKEQQKIIDQQNTKIKNQEVRLRKLEAAIFKK